MPSWGPPPPGRCTCTYWVYIWVLPNRAKQAANVDYNTRPGIGLHCLAKLESRGDGVISPSAQLTITQVSTSFPLACCLLEVYPS